MDNLESRQLYLKRLHKTPFLSTPIHTPYFYILLSGQLVTNILYAFQECPLTRASTGKMLYMNKIYDLEKNEDFTP